MSTVYLDHFGCYVALVAAFYRCGLLGEHPRINDILGIEGFASHTQLKVGKLIYVGRDTRGGAVYTLGVGKEASMVMTAAQDLLHLLKCSQTIDIIDVSAFNPSLLKIIWHLNVYSPWKKVCAYLSAFLLKRNFPLLLRYLRAQKLATP